MTDVTLTDRPAPAVPVDGGRARLVLGIVLVSYFMIVLDNSVIFTGLPQIQAGLGLSASGLSWVQNAYTLVFGGLLLLGARAGDLLGRRQVFIAGLVVFSTASLLVGAAQSEAWIIAARALQGVGAAVVAPSSLALISATFPAGPQRARAVAAYGTTAGLGASLGLVAGGALASAWSWRAGFLVNVPIGAVLILAALRFLPRTRPQRGRFDLIGALTSTLGMGGLVYGIVAAGEHGWTSPAGLVPIAAGLVVLAVFVADQARAVQPILPLRLFASRERSGAAIARLLFAGTMIAFFFFTTQFLQGVYGWNPLQAGLAFLPMTVVQFGFSLLVPRWTARFGNATLLATGLGFVLAGLVWMTQIEAGTSYWTDVAAPMVLIGLGQGLAFGPLTAAGIAGARPGDAGAASGLVNTAHQLGSTLGVAVLTTVAAGATTLARRVGDAYLGATVMLAVALITVLVLVVPADRARTRPARRAR